MIITQDSALRGEFAELERMTRAFSKKLRLFRLFGLLARTSEYLGKSGTLDADPKEWITVNGAAIPLDKDGEPAGKVGEKIKAESGTGGESKGSVVKSPNDVTHVRQNKNKFPITQGTTITRKAAFAGKGSKTPLRDENRLLKDFGGKKGQWSHEAGTGYVDFRRESRKAEIHWFSEPSVGIVGAKVTRFMK